VQSILPFLFVLGVLIFVHELGHFLVARWHGVRVLVFSLGFGPKIVSVKRGDTEYCISAIPLGGYVKMAGEALDSDAPVPTRPDEFLAKTKWQRFQIYVAGPIMNMLAAIVIMTGVYYHGAPEPAYLKHAPKVGSVPADSPAARAGLRPGDVIVSVAGKPVSTWEQLEMAVLPKAGREIDLVVQRDGTQRTVRVVPAARTKFELGDIGVGPDLRPQIREVYAGEPAERGGLKRGDVVHEVNGAAVDYEGLLKAIKSSPGKPLTLTVARNGARVPIAVTPVNRNGEGRIGVMFSAFEEREIVPGFLGALKLSWEKNLEWSTLIFTTFAGLFSGETPHKQLMGPVGIAQLSQGAAEAGWVPLLSLMAMISLNLGILNLLPIPMLDGGHIFIMALEGAARRDFSMRLKERLLMAGFVLIMMLMVTVIYNDLMRIDWIERLVPWR
jgi:regulator of sigma E protease